MASTESSLGTAAMPAPPNYAKPVQYTQDELAMIGEVHQRFPDASDWRFDKIGSEFIDGNTYTVYFATKQILNKDNSWFYAYVDKSGCRLFNDGDQAVAFMQGVLERRRSFVQRLRDFDFLDIIGALIALPITFAFVFIIVAERGGEDAISKEFLAIVSLILGYYFGRNKLK